jgi:hypothetical protein
MKKRIVILLAACIAYAASTSVASAFMQNWKLDLDGAGGNPATTITELVNTIGDAFIVNTLTSATTFNFNDNGFFVGNSHDAGADISRTDELTATFHATGFGTLGGSITFDKGGALKLYSDPSFNYGSPTTGGTFFGANDGTLIAQFAVVSGSATIGTSGVPNGQFTVSLQADDGATANAAGLVNGFRPGYFFDTTGTDLSLYLQPFNTVFGFSTTNASQLQDPIDPTLSNALSGFSGGLPVTNVDPLNLVVSNNGQFRLDAVAVPESGALALIGAGLLSLTIFGKRHMKKEF